MTEAVDPMRVESAIVFQLVESTRAFFEGSIGFKVSSTILHLPPLRLGFLYKRYEPEWYFWEVIIMLRRFLMTAVLVFGTSNGLLQVGAWRGSCHPRRLRCTDSKEHERV